MKLPSLVLPCSMTLSFGIYRQLTFGTSSRFASAHLRALHGPMENTYSVELTSLSPARPLIVSSTSRLDAFTC